MIVCELSQIGHPNAHPIRIFDEYDFSTITTVDGGAFPFYEVSISSQLLDA